MWYCPNCLTPGPRRENCDHCPGTYSDSCLSWEDLLAKQANASKPTAAQIAVYLGETSVANIRLDKLRHRIARRYPETEPARANLRGFSLLPPSPAKRYRWQHLVDLLCNKPVEEEPTNLQNDDTEIPVVEVLEFELTRRELQEQALKGSSAAQSSWRKNLTSRACRDRNTI